MPQRQLSIDTSNSENSDKDKVFMKRRKSNFQKLQKVSPFCHKTENGIYINFSDTILSLRMLSRHILKLVRMLSLVTEIIVSEKYQ